MNVSFKHMEEAWWKDSLLETMLLSLTKSLGLKKTLFHYAGLAFFITLDHHSQDY